MIDSFEMVDSQTCCQVPGQVGVGGDAEKSRGGIKGVMSDVMRSTSRQTQRGLECHARHAWMRCRP